MGDRSEMEVSAYLSMPIPPMDTCPLQWWKNHCSALPRLAALAKKFLIIPASSAPSERVFSKLNIVINKKRARLSTERAEHLVFIKHNKHLLHL